MKSNIGREDGIPIEVAINTTSCYEHNVFTNNINTDGTYWKSCALTKTFNDYARVNIKKGKKIVIFKVKI